MGKRSNKKKKRKRKLRQQNIVIENKENKTETIDKEQFLQSRNKRILFAVSEFLQKWAFPVICIIYSLLLMTSFVSKDTRIRFRMSLFMSLLSLFISIIFSGFSEKYIEKILSKIPIKNLLKIAGLCQFFFVVIFTFLIWNFLTSTEKIYTYIFEIGIFGDIFTWLSILIFFVDKNIKR
jgi:hypothetical protein